MANEYLLSIISQGVEYWNRFKAENPHIVIDLSNAQLPGAQLSGANLTGPEDNEAILLFQGGADLTGVDFTNADLSGANLFQANLTGAKLSGANLSNANLQEARLTKANLSGALLSGTNFFFVQDMQGINFQNTDLTGISLLIQNLAGSNFSGAKLHQARLLGANLSNCNLSNADFSNAILTDANLTNATLDIVNFDNAILTRTDFSGTSFVFVESIKNSNLSEANLSGIQFSHLDFSGVNLNKANLHKSTFMFVKFWDTTNFSESNLSNCDFHGDLSFASFLDANLSNSVMSGLDLYGCIFSNAKLINTNLSGSRLQHAKFDHADLTGANLSGIDLSRIDFSFANLSNVNLRNTTLVETNLEQTSLSNCKVYGLSAWNLIGTPKDQDNLVITPDDEPSITVGDLKVAQFIYLLVNNENVRNVIDTLTSKVVLILGRFTEERKFVLDAIRDELRIQNFTPIVFDFDKPTSKDVTGTVETLARMARFIIADLTDPSSIPHELATLVPHLRTTPIQLIRLKGSSGYSMIQDYYGAYSWLLKPYFYDDSSALIAEIPQIIKPADEMAESIRNRN